MIKHVKKEVILLVLIMTISLIVCGAVTAHPGHGTPIEEPSDPGIGDDPGTGVTYTGSTSSSGSSGASTSSVSTSSRSTSSRDAKSSNSITVGTETGTDTQTRTDGISLRVPEEVNENTESSIDSVGGPIAMIGLMVVFGLIFMSFPYKKGSTLNKLQINLFER